MTTGERRPDGRGPAPGRDATRRKLPNGRLPAIGVAELAAALERRRARRSRALEDLRHAVAGLRTAVERHIARVATLREAVAAQGGDLRVLKHYDSMMARLRAELRSAEESLAAAFRSAAESRRAGSG